MVPAESTALAALEAAVVGGAVGVAGSAEAVLIAFARPAGVEPPPPLGLPLARPPVPWRRFATAPVRALSVALASLAFRRL